MTPKELQELRDKLEVFEREYTSGGYAKFRNVVALTRRMVLSVMLADEAISDLLKHDFANQQTTVVPQDGPNVENDI